MSKTVVWRCPDCRCRYEERDRARACCGGDEDDPDAADGIAYDYKSDSMGVILGP